MVSIITLCSTIVGIFAFLIILLKFKDGLLQKSLLLTFVFSLTYFSFLIHLIVSNHIMAYPHFYRTAIALPYLIPICFYLLSRLRLEPEKPIRWYEWLLLILPVLNTLEHIPFFMLSGDAKRAFLKIVYTEGFENIYHARESPIPVFYNYVAQLSLGTILYLMVMWKAHKCIKKYSPLNKQNKWHYGWWFTPAILLSFCYLFALLGILSNQLRESFYFIISTVYGLTLLGVVIYFFLTPQLIYGKSLQNHISKKPIKPAPLPFSDEELQKYQAAIEAFFSNQKEFLEIDFRLQHLADALDLKKNNLSFLINHIYQQNFNQLVNERRIRVVLEKWEKLEWQNLSLNGIANEVGFGSRTTFIKAFRDSTGMYPSEYQKKRF